MKKILFVVLLLLASLNPAYAYSWDELKYVTKDDRFSYYIPIYALVHYLWLGRPSPIFVLD